MYSNLTLGIGVVLVYLYTLYGFLGHSDAQYKASVLGTYAAIQIIYFLQPWKVYQILVVQLIGTGFIWINNHTFYKYYALPILAFVLLVFFTTERVAGRRMDFRPQSKTLYSPLYS